MIPIEGFWPDNDDYAPGVIKECTNLVPTAKGYAGAPALSPAAAATLSNACVGSAIVTKLDNSYRTFAGTQTAVYELSSGTWTDRSRTAMYTLSTSNRWRFVQFGNSTIAANGNSTLQESSSGIFQDISGAPVAACIDAVNGFVFVGNTEVSSDQWKCCALQDATDWTEDVTTQCVSGRLLSYPGPITAVRRLGSNIVLYKEKAMYVGSYVGAPQVWNIQHIPGDIGVATQESVVNIGPVHIFIGPTDIYTFDGSRPVSIGNGIKEWFFSDLNKAYASKIIGAHNPLDTQVWFFYPSNSSGTGAIDSAIIFNYKYQKWGHATVAVESVFDYSTGAVTYANISDYFATYSAINIAYDSPFWSQGSPIMAAFNTSHAVKLFVGNSETSDMTTGVLGMDDGFSLLCRVRPRFITAPTSATMTNYYTNTGGDVMTEDGTVTMSNGKFDLLRSARWHQVKLSFTGPVEISGNEITMKQEGME